MNKVVAILPYVYAPYLDECLATLQIPREQILFVDGRLPEDGGCAWAINKGIDFMNAKNADWLVVLNPALRFGEEGGNDILDYLYSAEADRTNMIFFKDREGNNLAWHCCAISRQIVDAIGKLDTNFSPVYFEDVDYDLRYRKAFGKGGIKTAQIDVINESYGHSVKLAGKKPDVNYLITYFATKWGIHPSAVHDLKSYDFPFNDKKNSFAFWPAANGGVWNE